MPPGPALSAQEIDCLREWAAGGSAGTDSGTGMDAAMDAPVAMDAGVDAPVAMDAARDVAAMDAPRDVAADVPADTGCAAGQMFCNGSCVNTQTNPRNCGACGNVCTATGVCNNGTCTTCGAAPAYATAIQPIWNNNCTNCHDATTPPGGLNLTAAASHGELVGVDATCSTTRTLVVANEALNSYLINKLTGNGMCSGARMPAGGAAALNATQMGLIRNWICNGAMNN